MLLTASFVRRRGGRDHIYVRRSDMTSCEWAFPTYGDGLPHDLCHLVVEEMLGITDGFWGLGEQGTRVQLVDNEAMLMRDGRPLTEHRDVNLSGLLRAEEAVAFLSPAGMVFAQVGELAVALKGSVAAASSDPVTDRSALGFSLPANADASKISAIHQRLDELGAGWRNLTDGEAITLEFTRRSG